MENGTPNSGHCRQVVDSSSKAVFFLPRCFDCCDKELGAVAVLARVGHRQNELLVLQLEVLVVKGVAVDAGKYYVTELTLSVFCQRLWPYEPGFFWDSFEVSDFFWKAVCFISKACFVPKDTYISILIITMYKMGSNLRTQFTDLQTTT